MTDVARVEPRQSVGTDVLRVLGLDPSKPEVQALVLVANRYSLDPLLGEIELIAQRGKWEPYITRDGYLWIAHRSGKFDGMRTDELRRNTTNDGWTAYVKVWRKDMKHAFRLGAQCKDTEPQAKAGNGPEQALARAERRTLKRAFNVREDGADDDGGTDGPVAVVGEVRPPALAEPEPPLDYYDPADDPGRPFE